MPAVSKAQQRFMGMVYATKKGEMTNPSPEVAKAAASIKKTDAKDFASTKHKKLPEKKVAKEAKDFSQRDKIMKKAKRLHKHLYKNLHKKDMSGDVNEGFKTDILTDRKYAKKVADKQKEYKERDTRMKYGKNFKKFVKDASAAKDRLRPGEVKRYDKEKGKWVSNKD
tara:strand:- start:766 stop:1269 length:504 start_codon:yes stop_codon:yes gene_type:complete